MTAPKGYFDSVQRVAKKLTEKIQGDLILTQINLLL